MNEELIQKWKAKGYDYNKDFYTDSKAVSQQTTTTIEEPAAKTPTAESLSTARSVLVVVCIIVLMVVVGLLFYKKLSIPTEHKVIEITDEDTIYGIEFEQSIDAMEQKQDYFQCIRLKYLQLLRLLHDNRHIYWTISKTPTQYTYEVQMPEFDQITNIFMKIRYGNYPASKQLYEEESALYDTILEKKGGTK